MNPAGLLLGLLPGVSWLLAVRFALVSKRIAGWTGCAEVNLPTACILSTVFCGGWTMLGAELLSLMAAFNASGVTLLWLVFFAGLLGANLRCRQRLRDRWKAGAVPRNRTELFIAIAAALLLVGAALQGWFAPPNTGDALAYHLPRQIYWIQQSRIWHFFTNDIRQVIMPPFAEICGAHLLLLSDADRFQNPFGWSTLGVTAVVVGAMARQLGAPRTGSLLAALLTMACPMALLEASNAKNDLLAGLWVCIFAYWTIRTVRAPRLGWLDAVVLGTAAGLAMATKGTAPVFLLPWGLFLVAGVFARRVEKIPALLWRLVMIALVVGLINGPHLLRNERMFGSPTGPSPDQGGYQLANERMTLGAFTSNGLRNLAPFTALPWPAWNAAVLAGVESIHRGIGVAINDPQLTYYHTTFAEVALNLNVDELATAPVHFWSLLIALGLMCRPGKRDEPWRWRVAAHGAIVGSFGLFCLWLKWQPWHPRLLLPLVLLAAPPIAAEFSLRKGSWLVPIAAALATLTALTAFTCARRSLVGPTGVFARDRFTLLCLNDAPLAQSVAQACDLAASLQPRSVGFFDVWDNPIEYVLMQALEDRLPDAVPLFVQTNREAMFSQSPRNPWLPDLILMRAAVLQQLRATNPGSKAAFAVIGKFGDMVVLKTVHPPEVHR